jgi:RNA-directed DNA polymerase
MKVSKKEIDNSVTMPGELFPNSWLRIGLAAQKKGTIFNNLMCHFNMENMCEAFNAQKENKASGIDGISKKTYGKNLEANLNDLLSRIHKGSYKPQNKREILIPKADGKSRPIAISCFEDKIVEWMIGRILECIYEPLFIRNSFGFRPSKSTDSAIKGIYYSLKDNRRPNVVEIDFAKFFNSIPHKKMMRIIGKRISDNRFKGLIGRFLKVGILEESGEVRLSEVGTSQGSIMSPVLANIYLHEVLDKWFLENYGSYNNIIIRYADDAVFFFKKKDTANNFVKELYDRVEEYGLSLNKDKTKAINFDKNENNSFDFLGFTFYWASKATIRKRILKLKTKKSTLHKKIAEFYEWIKLNRSKLKTREIWDKTKKKLIGHYNYYGYRMNRPKLYHFYNEAIKSLFKWLNRRSQKRSYSWEFFKRKLEFNPLPRPPEVGKLKHFRMNPYLC